MSTTEEEWGGPPEPVRVRPRVLREYALLANGEGRHDLAGIGQS